MEKETAAMTAEKEQNKDRTGCYAAAISILCSGLLLSGAAGLLGELIPFGGNLLFLAVSAGTAVLVILSQQKKALEVILPLFLLTAAFALLFFRMEAVIQGMLSIANTVLKKWNMIFDTYLPLYGFSSDKQEDLAPAVCILGILVGIFTGYGVWRQWLGLLTGEVFVILAAGCLLQGNPSFYPVILLLAGWLGVWTGSRAGNRRNQKIPLCICVLTLLFGWGGGLLLSGYQPGHWVDRTREQIETAIHDFRFGKDSLPKGDLRRAGSLPGKTAREEEKETLELSFDQAQEMHLRGFVGAEYDGQSWRQLPGDDYTGRQEGMLDWLESRQFLPAFAWAACQSAGGGSGNIPEDGQKDSPENEDVSETLDAQTVHVINRGADRRYLYVPETVEAVTRADYKCNQDWQLLSRGFFGEREYQFVNLPVRTAQELPQAPDWLEKGETPAEEQYIQAEGVYRSFVYQYYLDVDETIKEEINRLFFSGESWKQEETVNLYDATARIRVMLSALVEYEPRTEEVPEGKDFVTWLLEEHREGNAVHFATAAVLAYRTLGIPARYAEGYYVSEDMAERLQAEGADSCQLTQKNGHAWAEIYIDGVGWTPVEVTPGFYQEVYAPEYYIDIQKEEIEKSDTGAAVEADEILSGAEEKQEKGPLAEVPWNVLGIVLLIILSGLGIFLLLELQRLVRIGIRTGKEKKYPEKLASFTYESMCAMLRCAGIRENFRYPYMLTEQICGQFSAIKEEEYIRVIQIIQKNIFGKKELFPNESRILMKFTKKMKTELYAQASWKKKLLYRYMYCH